MADTQGLKSIFLSTNLFSLQRSAVNDGFEASSPQMPKTGARICQCLFQRWEILGKGRKLCRSQARSSCPVEEAQVLLKLLRGSGL